MIRLIPLTALGLGALLTLACGSDEKAAASSGEQEDAGLGGAAGASSADSGTHAELTLTSDVFVEGQAIPQEYRCVAPSPELAWDGAPADAKSFALILQDVTPGFSSGFFHWVLYDVPGSARGLGKGVEIAYAPADPEGAHQGPNWSGTLGYSGPCGGNNTYELTLTALDVDVLPDLSETSPAAAIASAVETHAIATTKLTILSHP